MTNKTNKRTDRYITSVIYCVLGLAINGIFCFWNIGDSVMPRAVSFVAVVATVTCAVALFVQKRNAPDFGIEAFYQLSIGFAIGSGIMGIFVIFFLAPILALFLSPFALPLVLHLVDLLVRACMKKQLAGEMDGKLKVRFKDPIVSIAFALCAAALALTLAAVIALFIVQPWGGFATLVFIVPLAAVPFVFFLVRKQIRDIAFLFGVTFGFNAILSAMPVIARTFYLVDCGIIVGTAFLICCILSAIVLALLIRQCVRNSRARSDINSECRGNETATP